METFLGEIILESLVDASILSPYRQYLVKERIAEEPEETIPLWHIHRYRMPRKEVLEIADKLSKGLVNGEWYVHFFSEQKNDLYVILSKRIFLLPKQRDSSWDEMIRYGESVGIASRWTTSIPVQLPD